MREGSVLHQPLTVNVESAANFIWWHFRFVFVAGLFPEQLCVCSGSDKHSCSTFTIGIVDFVYQQEVSTNMTLPVTSPITCQCMVLPFNA